MNQTQEMKAASLATWRSLTEAQRIALRVLADGPARALKGRGRYWTDDAMPLSRKCIEALIEAGAAGGQELVDAHVARITEAGLNVLRAGDPRFSA